MSVQVNTYVIYGAVLPYARDAWAIDGDDLYDRLEDYIDSAFETKDVNKKRGVTVLFDGMNGQYVAVGRVFAKTGNYKGFDAPVSPSADPDLLEMVEANVREVLNEAEFKGEPAFGWHVISHYR